MRERWNGPLEIVDLVRDAFENKSFGFQLVDAEAIGNFLVVLAFQYRIRIESLRGVELS